VCEYEVNRSTNEKVITGKQNLLKNNVEYQGHMNDNVIMLHVCESNNVCEYEVNRLTNEKVIRGKQNFNANCLRRWTPASPDGFIFEKSG